MAKKSSSENPTSARTISKRAAMLCCANAIMKIDRNFTWYASEYRIEVPSDETPESVAAALGGTLVGTAEGAIFGIASRRIAIVRLSTAMLTSSLSLQAAETKAAYVFEQVAMPTTGQALLKVSTDVFNGKSIKTTFEEVASSAQKATATIAGDAVQVGSKAITISRAAVNFVVILDIMQSIHAAYKDLAGQTLQAEDSIVRRDCAAAIHAAAEAAWKKAPEIFHKHSFPTKNTVPRFYVEKSSRQN